MHEFKYRNQPKLAYYLGLCFASEILLPLGLYFDLVVPVPMHASRRSRRSYNQSLELAKGIAACGRWNVVDLLKRHSHKNTQTELNRWDRFVNTSWQFAFESSYSLEDKHVLLVDDIVTTGATMVACAQPLVEAGAKISIATAALSQTQ